MVPIAQDVLGVLLRWLHIASAALLVGGFAYARAVAVPALRPLSGDLRDEAWRRLALRFQPVVYGAIAGLLVSGVYNYLIHPGHTRHYHIVFGVKMLLAAHVFAASLLALKEPRPGRMTGLAISGFLVILLAACLTRIF
ncbi:MAG: hypothetical protein ACLQGV_05345 [Bryobacteraceae bacterium]